MRQARNKEDVVDDILIFEWDGKLIYGDLNISIFSLNPIPDPPHYSVAVYLAGTSYRHVF
jgi:hypothetical protein